MKSGSSNTKTGLLQDERAYIPFAVIGVFILLFSVLASVYIMKTDYELAKVIHGTDVNDMERTAMDMVSSDLARCLNYAGMQALAWYGEHPVVTPEGTSKKIKEYDGFSVYPQSRNVEPGETVRISVTLPSDVSKAISCLFSEHPRTLTVKSDSGRIYKSITYDDSHSFWSSSVFEEEIIIPWDAEYAHTYVILEYANETKAVNWFHVGSSPLKDITAEYFNDYLRTNYQANQYTFNNYAINIEPHVYPSQIRIDKINASLKRELESSALVVGEHEYPLYFTMTVSNLNYTLVDLSTNNTYQGSMDITSHITSRMPLLEHLVNEYENELNSGVTSDVVMGATNIRTFSYGPWQHYLKGPLNIITGPSLTASVNVGTLYTQKKIFDSVDPWALTYTTYYNGKVLYNDIKRDTSRFEEEKNKNLTTTYEALAGKGTFNISVSEGINESMRDANTSIEEIEETSNIVISVSNFTSEVYSNWIYDDRKWSISEPDLLHDVTREVYSGTIKGQVFRDGFDQAFPYDLQFGPTSYDHVSYQGGSSRNAKAVTWTSYHPLSFSHTCALTPDHTWNGTLDVEHRVNVDASSHRWYYTSVDVDHVSTHIEFDGIDVNYEYLGNDKLVDSEREYDYLLYENRTLDWRVTYNVRLEVETRWDIYYTYHWSYQTYTPTEEGGNWNFFSGHSSGSQRRLLESIETIRHSQTENENMSIVYHQYLPSGGYAGINSIYGPGSLNDYKNTTVIINGSKVQDPGCSDAADKYREQEISVKLHQIKSDYRTYADRTFLPAEKVYCDIPVWLKKEMAQEMEIMFNAINTENPTREISLLGENLGRNPTHLIQEASLDIASEISDSAKRERFINIEEHLDSGQFITSSDASRAIAKNEAYERLLKEIQERNRDISDSFDDYIDGSFDREQGYSITGLLKNAVPTDVLFNNPAIDIASTALASEMGVIGTMQVVGMPDSKYNWTENMTILVDQYPDYLYHDPGFDMQGQYMWTDEATGLVIYPLGVRNVCVFSTGIGDSIAEMLEKGTGPLKDAIAQSMSKNIADMNSEINSLIDDIGSQSEELVMNGMSVDTALIEQNRNIMVTEYSAAVRHQLPDVIAEEVSKDPVLSTWISYSEVRLITATYINTLSDEELVNMLADSTLNEELFILLSESIRVNNSTISPYEIEVALYRLEADLRIGIADGVSESIRLCQETIDECFENINAELQRMLDESTDKLTGHMAEKMEQRLQKSMRLVPSGLPVIPPHWICTVNIWEYNVKGMYETFKIVDHDNQCLFNPHFGHDAQVYVRKNDEVFHPTKRDSDGSLIYIGDNQRIEFGFSGYAATVVGPGPKGVGDKVGGRDERSIAYDDFESQI